MGVPRVACLIFKNALCLCFIVLYVAQRRCQNKGFVTIRVFFVAIFVAMCCHYFFGSCRLSEFTLAGPLATDKNVGSQDAVAFPLCNRETPPLL